MIEFENLRVAADKEEKEDEIEPELKGSHLYQMNAPFLNRGQILAERIVALAINNPNFIKKIAAEINYFPEPYSQIIKLLQSKEFDSGILLEREKIKDLTTNEELIKIIDYLYLKNGYETELLNDLKIDPLTEINKNLIELKKEDIKDKLTQLNFELKQAEEENNSEKIKVLLDQINQLTQQLINNNG